MGNANSIGAREVLGGKLLWSPDRAVGPLSHLGWLAVSSILGGLGFPRLGRLAYSAAISSYNNDKKLPDSGKQKWDPSQWTPQTKHKTKTKNLRASKAIAHRAHPSMKQLQRHKDATAGQYDQPL